MNRIALVLALLSAARLAACVTAAPFDPVQVLVNSVAFYTACDDAIRDFAPNVRMGAIGGVNTGLIPLTVDPDWMRTIVTELECSVKGYLRLRCGVKS